MSDSKAVDMYKQVLATCEAEFGQLNQIFQVLDTKAQATASVAGIFLAATFAFVQNLKMNIDIYYIVLLAASIGLLLLAVLFAILGMWIQNLIGRPTVEFVRQLLLDLISATGSDSIGNRAEGFYGDQVHEWIPIIQRLRFVLRRKGRFVAWAQFSLALSLVAVSSLTILYLAKGAPQ